MKALLQSLVLLFLVHTASAQIVHNKVFGGSGDDIAMCVRATPDSGYILAGYTNSNDGDVTGNHGSNDVWIVKIDSAWNVEWQKCLGGTESDVANSIALTADGGYVIGGATRSNDGDVSGNHGGSDLWVVKIDSLGNIQWQKSLGGTGNDAANGVVPVDNSGYMLAGYSNSINGDVSANHGNNDLWVIRLDAFGSVTWQRSYGDTRNDRGNAICQTSGKTYVVAGRSNYYNYLLHIDSVGELVWQKMHGAYDDEKEWFAVIPTSDGDFVPTGTLSSYNYCPYNCQFIDDYSHVLKFDNTGGVKWQYFSAGNSNQNQSGLSIVEVLDSSGFIIAGRSGTAGADLGGCEVYKLSVNGKVIWQQTFGGTGYEEGRAVILSHNVGNYVIAGHTASTDGDITGNHGGNDFWLFEISDNTCDSIQPVLFPTATQNICYGDTALLTVTGNGIAPTTYNITQPGYYSYTHTSPLAHGFCTEYTSTTQVNASPTCITTGDSKICPGDSTTFRALGGNFFSWSGPGGFTANIDSTGPIFLEGTYTVTITDTNGCSRSCSRSLNFHSIPYCYIITDDYDDSIICAHETTTFYSGASYSDIVIWSGPNGFTSDEAEVGPLSLPGTYSVVILDRNTGCSRTCSKTLILDSLNIRVDSISANRGNRSGAIAISVTGGFSPYSFHWSNGATAEDIQQLSDDTYSISVTDAQQCTATLDSITVHLFNTITAPTNHHITMSPNPAHETLFVSLDNINLFSRITLADISGRVVAQSNTTETAVCALASGLYLAKVELKNGVVVVKKIIVE